MKSPFKSVNFRYNSVYSVWYRRYKYTYTTEPISEYSTLFYSSNVIRLSKLTECAEWSFIPISVGTVGKWMQCHSRRTPDRVFRSACGIIFINLSSCSQKPVVWWYFVPFLHFCYCFFSFVAGCFYRASACLQNAILSWQIRPSVRLSHAGIVSKCMHISSNSFHHLVGEWWTYSFWGLPRLQNSKGNSLSGSVKYARVGNFL